MINGSYSYCERLLRANVFQVGVIQGNFEWSIIWLFNAITAIVKSTLHSDIFDPERAERGKELWQRLGAHFHVLQPRDLLANIQTMHVKSSELEGLINSRGGRWERATLQDGRDIFAIFLPAEPDERWNSLERDLLSLKWKKQGVVLENGEAVEVIVTCEEAGWIPDESVHQKLFMHVNSASVSFIMLRSRAGFYLGCKQDICFYDPRGTWLSSGTASEAGYYNDVEAVFDWISPHYDLTNIWVSSACGGSGPAGHLLAKTHGRGVNYIRENGFTKLFGDFVENQPMELTRWFADKHRDGLKSRDIPEEHKPRETYFDVKDLWTGLGQTDIGKVIIIHPMNDQHLPDDVNRKHVKRALRVHSQVKDIPFNVEGPNPHAVRYFEKRGSGIANVLSYVFTNS